jgi:hypothetical protein
MSKFDKIFEAREQETEVKTKKPTAVSTKKAATSPDKKVQPEPVDIAEPILRGRPRAKRSDPDFLGFTTYIRRDTHTKVKIALLQEGKGRELSELVEELLGKWAEHSKS